MCRIKTKENVVDYEDVTEEGARASGTFEEVGQVDWYSLEVL